MVEVLVVPDGAAEDPRLGRTSLERAHTPALDALCREGEVRARRTIPHDLAAGSEVGIPTLLGAEPSAAPSRGSIEAAAVGVEVPVGRRAWRVDCQRGREGDPALRAEAARLQLKHLRGHRFLFVGPRPPEVSASWRVWPDGPTLARAMDDSTVVVAAPGAASGCAQLLGARVIVPRGATGDTEPTTAPRRAPPSTFSTKHSASWSTSARRTKRRIVSTPTRRSRPSKRSIG